MNCNGLPWRGYCGIEPYEGRHSKRLVHGRGVDEQTMKYKDEEPDPVDILGWGDERLRRKRI